MAAFKGTPAKLFVAGIPFLAIGAILYAWSERLEGAENTDKAITLGWAGGIVFVIGVGLWVAMMVTGFKGKPKQ